VLSPCSVCNRDDLGRGEGDRGLYTRRETSIQSHVRRLYQLRRDLLRLRNAAVPLVELCRRLEQPGLPGIHALRQPLFRDVSDHILRVQEEIESIRQVLAFAFAISLMAGQAQQTEITGPFRIARTAAAQHLHMAISGPKSLIRFGV
jgi:magnesium transporter